MRRKAHESKTGGESRWFFTIAIGNQMWYYLVVKRDGGESHAVLNGRSLDLLKRKEQRYEETVLFMDPVIISDFYSWL